MKITLLLNFVSLSTQYAIQTVEAPVNIHPKVHDKCTDLGEEFQCQIIDDFKQCSAPCESQSGLIIKRKCECFKYFMGIARLYSEDHCKWIDFDNQCFESLGSQQSSTTSATTTKVTTTSTTTTTTTTTTSTTTTTTTTTTATSTTTTSTTTTTTRATSTTTTVSGTTTSTATTTTVTTTTSDKSETSEAPTAVTTESPKTSGAKSKASHDKYADVLRSLDTFMSLTVISIEDGKMQQI